MKKIIFALLLTLSGWAQAAFVSTDPYIIVRATNGRHYFLQADLYYEVFTPYTAVTAATVGPLAQGFSSGSSGGGGGATTIAAGADVTLGNTTDAACAGDNTSGCTVESRLIRIAQNLTTVNTSVNATFAVTTATLTNVAASATSVTCLASNASRKGAIFVNDSVSATAYFKYGATASTTSHTFQVLPGGTLTLPNSPIYTGIVDCIWSAATGSARVTEE